MQKKGLALILHSGSYDRLYQGMSVALAALALGRVVKLFFTYWALETLRKDAGDSLILDEEARAHRKILEKNLKEKHMQKISQLYAQAKIMGAKFYACTQSMGLLNISRDELVKEVDKSMGLTTFLTEALEDQLLFI
ncbi:MAG: hypothetical protein A3J51_04275 [Omnitrophica WOR_2 bacterium RIFCSPHIGHO2_02_FULL_45_21]|nr:MAG: hypothetical protein A3J51_04275 [Omnitrophica WOR_2 bacterium RIFCSPHIGHO2_02_FULL_45_21]